ncbi:MAG: glutaredoxin family protein [Solirubrobacteraceae bacterium]
MSDATDASNTMEAGAAGEAGTPRIVVYTTDRCPYCIRAKRLLDSKGLAYEEINLGRDPDGRGELAGRTGMMSFPQILIDGALLGGYEETAAAAASGRLDQLLAGSARGIGSAGADG